MARVRVEDDDVGERQQRADRVDEDEDVIALQKAVLHPQSAAADAMFHLTLGVVS